MEKQQIEAQKGFTLNEEERLQMARLLIKAGRQKLHLHRILEIRRKNRRK